jgi:outer membrane lipoprotein-sorting protein
MKIKPYLIFAIFFLTAFFVAAPSGPLYALKADIILDGDAMDEAEAKLQNTVVKNFIAWDKKLKTLALTFNQKTTFEGVDISSSQGKLYKKGQNIRLDNLEDGKIVQSALTDKKIIRVLDEKGQLITTLAWQDWQAAQPNKALFDFGNYSELIKSHKVVKFVKLKNNNYELILEPKTAPVDGETYQIDFILDGGDYFPKEISLTSQGIKTNTILTQISKNTEVKESLFK